MLILMRSLKNCFDWLTRFYRSLWLVHTVYPTGTSKNTFLAVAHILPFLDRLLNIITADAQMDAEQMRNMVIWDSASLHWSNCPKQDNWFHLHPQFSLQYLPPLSPFLNTIKFFVFCFSQHGSRWFTISSPITGYSSLKVGRRPVAEVMHGLCICGQPDPAMQMTFRLFLVMLPFLFWFSVLNTTFGNA